VRGQGVREGFPLRSQETTTYTKYGNIRTTFGLGVCHTGQPSQSGASADLTGLPDQAFRPACWGRWLTMVAEFPRMLEELRLGDPHPAHLGQPMYGRQNDLVSVAPSTCTFREHVHKMVTTRTPHSFFSPATLAQWTAGHGDFSVHYAARSLGYQSYSFSLQSSLYCFYPEWPLGDHSDTERDFFLIRFTNPQFTSLPCAQGTGGEKNLYRHQ
jgi:hypothetical protein